MGFARIAYRNEGTADARPGSLLASAAETHLVSWERNSVVKNEENPTAGMRASHLSRPKVGAEGRVLCPGFRDSGGNIANATSRVKHCYHRADREFPGLCLLDRLLFRRCSLALDGSLK